MASAQRKRWKINQCQWNRNATWTGRYNSKKRATKSIYVHVYAPRITISILPQSQWLCPQASPPPPLQFLVTLFSIPLSRGVASSLRAHTAITNPFIFLELLSIFACYLLPFQKWELTAFKNHSIPCKLAHGYYYPSYFFNFSSSLRRSYLSLHPFHAPLLFLHAVSSPHTLLTCAVSPILLMIDCNDISLDRRVGAMPRKMVVEEKMISRNFAGYVVLMCTNYRCIANSVPSAWRCPNLLRVWM